MILRIIFDLIRAIYKLIPKVIYWLWFILFFIYIYSPQWGILGLNVHLEFLLMSFIKCLFALIILFGYNIIPILALIPTIITKVIVLLIIKYTLLGIILFIVPLIVIIIHLLPVILFLCLTVAIIFIDIITITVIDQIYDLSILICIYIYPIIKISILAFYNFKVLPQELSSITEFFNSNYKNSYLLNNMDFSHYIYFKFINLIDFLSYNILPTFDVKDSFFINIITEIGFIVKILLFVIWLIFASIKFLFFFLIYPVISLIALVIDIMDTMEDEELESFPDQNFFFAEYLAMYRGQYYPDTNTNFYIFSEKIQPNSLNFIKSIALMYFDIIEASSRFYSYIVSSKIDDSDLIEIIHWKVQFDNYVNTLIVFEQIGILDFLEINHPTLSTSIKSIVKSDSFIDLFISNINFPSLYTYILLFYLYTSFMLYFTWMDFQTLERTNDLGILDAFIDIKNYIKNIFYKYFFTIIFYILLVLILLFLIGISILYILS